MGFADSRWAQQDHILGTVDEAQPGQLPYHLAVERRLALEVKLLQSFEPGEPCHPQPEIDPPLLLPALLRVEGVGQGVLIVEIGFGGLLTDAIELGEPVVQLQPVAEEGVSSFLCN